VKWATSDHIVYRSRRSVLRKLERCSKCIASGKTNESACMPVVAEYRDVKPGRRSIKRCPVPNHVPLIVVLR
jgi:hypothetical protein